MSIPKGKDKNRLLFGRPFITWSWAPEQVFADDVPVITHPSISGGQPLISQKSAAKVRIFHETTKQFIRNL